MTKSTNTPKCSLWFHTNERRARFPWHLAPGTREGLTPWHARGCEIGLQECAAGEGGHSTAVGLQDGKYCVPIVASKESLNVSGKTERKKEKRQGMLQLHSSRSGLSPSVPSTWTRDAVSTRGQAAAERAQRGQRFEQGRGVLTPQRPINTLGVGAGSRPPAPEPSHPTNLGQGFFVGRRLRSDAGPPRGQARTKDKCEHLGKGNGQELEARARPLTPLRRDPLRPFPGCRPQTPLSLAKNPEDVEGRAPRPLASPLPLLRATGLLVLTGAQGPVFLASILFPPSPLLTSRPLLQGPRPCPLLATLRGLASFLGQQRRR